MTHTMRGEQSLSAAGPVLVPAASASPRPATSPHWRPPLVAGDVVDRHYEVLCVGREASSEEIRSAYLRAIRAVHPDLIGAAGSEAAAALNTAFAVLFDPDARAAYDAQLALLHATRVPEPSRYAPPAHEQGFDRGSWDIPDWPR